MKIIGIRFVVEKSDEFHFITWQQCFEAPIEEIIRQVRYQKGWIGGKFLEICLLFEDDNNNSVEYPLKITDSKFNQLIS
jgi:hypothetical protein